MIIEAAVISGLLIYIYLILRSHPSKHIGEGEKYDHALNKLKSNIDFPHIVWKKH
jgi:hypothetical protein